MGGALRSNNNEGTDCLRTLLVDRHGLCRQLAIYVVPFYIHNMIAFFV